MLSRAVEAYPREAAPAWCEPFIGIPYEMGSRAADKVDCWGLVWLVLDRRFGIAVPSYEGAQWQVSDAASRVGCANFILQMCAEQWDAIEPGDERPGDVVVLRIARHPLHVGVVVLPGLMLHSDEGADSALERYDGRFWCNRVDGFFRWRA